LTDHIWKLIVQLREARPAVVMAPVSEQMPSPENYRSPALFIAGAFKVSLALRAGQIFRAILGLGPDAVIPTPNNTVRLLGQNPVFREARGRGEVGSFLDGMVDQRVFETLRSSSRKSYLSGIHSWVHSCDVVGIHPLRHLTPDEDEVARWLCLMTKESTARSYKSHLKMACRLAKSPPVWDGDRVKAVLTSLGKNPDGVVMEIHKWVCDMDLLGKMVIEVRTQFGSDMRWLSTMMVCSYHFQFRVFSEWFRARLADVFFTDMSEALGRQSVTIWLDRRKNRDVRHPITRHCTCKGKHVPVGVDPVILCPVHVLYDYLKADPVWQVIQETRSRGRLPATLATLQSEVAQNTVNTWLKRVAEKVGDPFFGRAASHGFRRGCACDMARRGNTLAEILSGGDWRSAAFREYLKSVQNDLAGRAMVQLLGACSDSDGE